MGNTLLIVGGLALACVGYYCYRRRKLQNSVSKEEMIDMLISDIDAEKIDKLSLSDVVNYFKGAQLKKGVDIPFIAVANKDGIKSYLLACYNEKTDEITHHRLLTPNSTDDKLRELLGNEKFVVLS